MPNNASCKRWDTPKILLGRWNVFVHDISSEVPSNALIYGRFWLLYERSVRSRKEDVEVSFIVRHPGLQGIFSVSQNSDFLSLPRIPYAIFLHYPITNTGDMLCKFLCDHYLKRPNPRYTHAHPKDRGLTSTTPPHAQPTTQTPQPLTSRHPEHPVSP